MRRALLTGLMIAVSCGPPAAPIARPFAELPLTHGVACGDVAATGAIIWGRCDRPTTMWVRAQPVGGGGETQMLHTGVTSDDDFIGKIQLEGLQAGSTYTYRVWCGDNESAARIGTFSTAPAADVPAPIRFVYGGDLGGQNVCRDRRRGYPIFDEIRARSPDFFVALGDLIYADDPCQAVGRFGNAQIPGPPAPAREHADFRNYWKYNRSDAAFQEMLASTSMYSVWDDHEIKNDAGPEEDTTILAPHVHLLPPALQAFLEYQPMLPPADTPQRLYSARRWGKHLEIFFLDLRQYRDPNLERDSIDEPKSMLGDRQRQWLLDAIPRSDATWKVIVSSVPLSVPTGSWLIGHDGWSGDGRGDGFEHERDMIVRAMQTSTPRNFVWITTDVHFGAAFSYRPYTDEPHFVFHEFISGPLHAGVFLKDEYDRALGAERLFLYGPTADIVSFEEAIGWFNFGLIEIAADGELTARLINGRGEPVYAVTIEPR